MSPSSGNLLRIGVVCHGGIGGSGTVAVNVATLLARRGHAVHLVSTNPPPRIDPATRNLAHHPVARSTYGILGHEDTTLPIAATIADVCRTHALDVLHVHHAVPNAAAALLARGLLGAASPTALVTTLHGTDVWRFGADPLLGPVVRAALAASDAVTAVSDALRIAAEAIGPPGLPIRVVPNFVLPRVAPSPESREATRARLGIAPDEVALLHASNLRPVKRIDLLLETLTRIRPRESFRLVVVAGGDWAPWATRSRTLGIEDRVVVVPAPDAVETYLRAADVALVTSDWEGFSLAALEAMACGVPVVATAVGGLPEVVADGETGLLSPAGDAAALARAVESLLDPAVRRSMGRAAAERAATVFPADAAVDAYEAVLRAATERRGGI